MSDVLYRAWRPQRFDEVVGQRHVTRTLTNALAAGQVGHAYLFAGPRGTGKTSVARILARAVNCRRGPTPDPCGECDACQAILNGSAVDVVEIDGGSNRKIEDARELRERVHLAPAQFRTKVYIIDEVHQLTDHAFNALLKTFEEPPAHVMFILATTDPQKIPVTIVSRCQRFDFHRLAARDILERLELVANASGLDVEPAALELMVRKAEGSLRDALSLLDQARAFAGTRIGAADLAEILGLVDDEGLAELTLAALESRAGDALAAVATFLDAGRDIRQLAEDLLQYGRDLLAARVAPDPAAVLDRPPEAVSRLRALAVRLDPAALTRWLRTLSQAVADLRAGAHPRLVLDVALLEFAGAFAGAGAGGTPAAAAEPSAAPARHADAQGNGGGARAPAGGSTKRPAVHRAPAPAVTDPAAPAPAEGDAGADARAFWSALLAAVKRARPTTHALLAEGRPVAAASAAVTVEFPADRRFHMESLQRGAHRTVVEDCLGRVLGRPVRLQCRLASGTAAGTAEPVPGVAEDEADRVVRQALELFRGELVDGDE